MAPENPAGYYRLGLLYQALKKNDLAMANFDKALEINPKLMDVFTSKVALLASQKDLDGALAAIDQQLANVGDNKDARAVIYNLKGGVLQVQDKKEAAEAGLP